MTPLLTLSHLPSPPGSAGRAAARGCRCRGRWGGAGFGRFRAPRSMQEPGEGAEAKVRLRLPRPQYCPAAPEADNPGAGGLRRGAEALAQGARHPPLPFTWTRSAAAAELGSRARPRLPGGGGGARALPEGGGPGARRMCCLTLRRPLGSRSSGTYSTSSLSGA